MSIQNSSGKHMICDIKNIKNSVLLNSPNEISKMLDYICNLYKYTILQKTQHIFEPQGFTALYLLSESHISIHTFPENNYAAIDIYTCRNYENNNIYIEIYNYIIKEFQAEYNEPIIINRKF